MGDFAAIPRTLDRQNHKFSILYEIALTVGKSLEMKAILDDVLDKVITFMGVDAGVIYVIDEQTMARAGLLQEPACRRGRLFPAWKKCKMEEVTIWRH